MSLITVRSGCLSSIRCSKVVPERGLPTTNTPGSSPGQATAKGPEGPRSILEPALHYLNSSGRDADPVERRLEICDTALSRASCSSGSLSGLFTLKPCPSNKQEPLPMTWCAWRRRMTRSGVLIDPPMEARATTDARVATNFAAMIPGAGVEH